MTLYIYEINFKASMCTKTTRRFAYPRELASCLIHKYAFQHKSIRINTTLILYLSKCSFTRFDSLVMKTSILFISKT